MSDLPLTGTPAQTGAPGAGPAAGPAGLAAAVHLAVPGPRASPARRAGAGLGYALAVAAGLVLAVAGRAVPAGLAAVAWVAAVACALPAVRLRYLAVAGRDRERLQWAGSGAVAAVTAGLAVVVLHLLVSWPANVAAVTAAATVLLPLALITGDLPGLGPAGGRVLVHVLSGAGFAAGVS